jgi:hypothetical protein
MTDENKIIRAGWLINGSGHRAVKDSLISISGGRISSVDEFSPNKKLLPSDFMDFSDCTVIP